jgi:hypothetical protein
MSRILSDRILYWTLFSHCTCEYDRVPQNAFAER